MKIFNSLTGKKETFNPKIKKEVSIYICGLTPYDDVHIGHARTFINFDVIVKFLRFTGFKVKYVRNITDVDDKIINRAKEEGIPALDFSKKYIKEMHNDFLSLGIDPPDVEPKVSDHIHEIISMIQTLEERDYAYRENKSDVFFNVQKFKDYGKLANRTLEQLSAAERTIKDLNKKHEADFVLWKVDTDGITWPSPWGQGRPGWHIECSVMSIKYLGEEFDIHGGGLDLKFPHHENEIAQSKCATEKKFATYWMHTGPLRIEDKKMSKSLKNFITVKDILKEFHPEVLRLFFLMTHYRSPISYSREGLENAKRVLDKFYTILSDKKTSSKFTEDKSFKEEFISVFQDDFNSPKAISILQVYARNAESEEDLEIDKFSTLKSLLNSLGLLSDETENYFKYGELDFSDDEIENLISNRNDARESKNFDLADEIRDQLITKGIVLEDLGDKTIWKKKS
jgi:cysteinyl-tRNA synthetase